MLMFRYRPSDTGLGAAFAGVAATTETLQLVGHGSVGSVDVDRIALKRIVITGYPARVHKRNAVIKHMFHRPEVGQVYI